LAEQGPTAGRPGHGQFSIPATAPSRGAHSFPHRRSKRLQFSDKLTEIDETEESEEERAQLIAMRSAAASRSTWISVAVNLC